MHLKQELHNTVIIIILCFIIMYIIGMYSLVGLQLPMVLAMGFDLCFDTLYTITLSMQPGLLNVKQERCHGLFCNVVKACEVN